MVEDARIDHEEGVQTKLSRYVRNGIEYAFIDFPFDGGAVRVGMILSKDFPPYIMRSVNRPNSMEASPFNVVGRISHSELEDDKWSAAIPVELLVQTLNMEKGGMYTHEGFFIDDTGEDDDLDHIADELSDITQNLNPFVGRTVQMANGEVGWVFGKSEGGYEVLDVFGKWSKIIQEKNLTPIYEGSKDLKEIKGD